VNFAAERIRPDDALLDFLIAMEAIYGDSSGAIGYKIGMRCAAFLESDISQRLKITELINQSYDKRSALVHGGKKAAKGQMADVNPSLLNYVQQSFHKIVDRILRNEGVPNGQDFDRILLTTEGKSGT
jgi:hypothetical protein